MRVCASMSMPQAGVSRRFDLFQRPLKRFAPTTPSSPGLGIPPDAALLGTMEKQTVRGAPYVIWSAGGNTNRFEARQFTGCYWFRALWYVRGVAPPCNRYDLRYDRAEEDRRINDAFGPARAKFQKERVRGTALTQPSHFGEPNRDLGAGMRFRRQRSALQVHVGSSGGRTISVARIRGGG